MPIARTFFNIYGASIVHWSSAVDAVRMRLRTGRPTSRSRVPDWRGYNVAGLDDMGNTPAGRLGAFFANPTVLGSAGGAPSAALAAGNIPPHTHSGSTGFMDRNNPHSHGVSGGTVGGTSTIGRPQTIVNDAFIPIGATAIGINNTDINHAHPFTTDGGAGLAGSAFGIISPRKLVTFCPETLATVYQITFPTAIQSRFLGVHRTDYRSR